MPGEDYQSWSVTAADNGNSDTSIEWREGQTRASVNNSSRSELAAHAKNRNLLNGSISTGGSANAQTFTSGVGYIAPIPTGLVVKLKIGAGLTNTASTTLNMDGLGDTTIKTDIGANLRGGELVEGCYTDLLFNGTNWIFLYSREFFQEQINGGNGIIISTRVISAAGNSIYTPSPGMVCCTIECIGGGGGGGNANAAVGEYMAGSGGGSGGYSRKLATAADIGAAQGVVVGVGGAGGSPGNAGAASQVGTLCIANGGGGGGYAQGAFGSSIPAGGAGGAPGTGDIRAAGAPGTAGFYNTGGVTVYNRTTGGGSGAFGGGALGSASTGYPCAGIAGGNYGGGGGGGISYNGSGLAVGGAGSTGVVIITEFAGRGPPGLDGATGPMGPAGPAGAGTGDVLVSGTPVAGQTAEWVDASHIRGVTGSGIAFTTGDVKLTFKTAADTGWVLMNDGSIGNAASGATTRANADTQALFVLLYTISTLQLQNSAGVPIARGGFGAINDYVGNTRLVMPAVVGRALAGFGGGAGLTPRALGTTFGAETHTQTTAELASHSHTYTSPGTTSGEVQAGSGATGMWGSGTVGAGGTTNSTGSSTPFNIMQPTTFLNVMIKL